MIFFHVLPLHVTESIGLVVPAAIVELQNPSFSSIMGRYSNSGYLNVP